MLGRCFGTQQAKLNRKLRQAGREEFLELAKAQAPEMDLPNVVVSLGRIAKMMDASGQGDCAATAATMSQLLSRCSGELVQGTDSWHSLTNLAWALCRLPTWEAPDFLNGQAVMAQILRRSFDLGLESAPGPDLPVLLWSLAWAQRSGAQLPLSPFTRQVFWEPLLLRLPEVTPQGLAMMLWSFAALESEGLAVPKRTYREVLQQVEQHPMSDFKAREVANMSWSVATVQASMPSWLLEELPERASEFGAQECANVFWSLAVTAQADHLERLLRHLEALPKSAVRDFGPWKPQEMASAAWAMAITLERRHLRRGSEILGRLRHQAVARVDQLEGKELSMLSSSLTEEDEMLAARIAEQAARLQEKNALSPDAIVQLSDHLQRVGHLVPQLEQSLQHLEDQTLQALEGEDVAEKLRGLGLTSLGMRTSSLLRCLGVVDGPPPADDLGEMAAFGQVLCLVSYSLQQGEHSLAETGRIVASGSASEGSPLQAVSLRFSRHRDAEFLALSSVLSTLGLSSADARGLEITGHLRLHVTHTPCLSCVWAMVQFRKLCPNVQLQITFDSI